MEKHIVFDNKEIIILNFHSSLKYSTELRYVLLKRLDELNDENVILLGDFNAAFKYQSESIVPENHKFLSILTNERYKFSELYSIEENEENPHYTFKLESTNKQKKLDHIFVSQSLFEKKFNYQIDYIDEVNRNFKGKKTNKEISTDHSGIKLTFSFGN
ncbi:MAG: hypothetical protein E6Z84_05220 [Clostridium sp.]|uniref:hypothetical protein n=1 Tax=Clostridium sp. TaxID=1506 RepID=UPI00290A3092|nr:hypothetical protein [Clostridium sp.]MDU5740144.1 hypothetical protein [Clostridium sp.]MDU5784256.1 hypothetical protein [Clostridium sp.]